MNRTDNDYRENENTLKLTIMRPYFSPYIGSWQLIHVVDTFVIYDDMTYIKDVIMFYPKEKIRNMSNDYELIEASR